MMAILKPDHIDYDLLVQRFHTANNTTQNQLLGMTFINSLYNGLKNATVDVRAAKIKFDNAHWVRAAIQGASQAIMSSSPSAMSTDAAYEKLTHLSPKADDPATSFACIAMMESGGFDLVPSQLGAVFALCSADSLYIASALIQDPASAALQWRHPHGKREKAMPQSSNKNKPVLHHDAGITRVRSNIGRAGMALMISPPNTMVHDYDLDD